MDLACKTIGGGHDGTARNKKDTPGSHARNAPIPAKESARSSELRVRTLENCRELEMHESRYRANLLLFRPLNDQNLSLKRCRVNG
jgi:hypothetical protein